MPLCSVVGLEAPWVLESQRALVLFPRGCTSRIAVPRGRAGWDSPSEVQQGALVGHHHGQQHRAQPGSQDKEQMGQEGGEGSL